MNKDDNKMLMHIQHVLGRKLTEKELKAYEALKKVILGDHVKKTRGKNNMAAKKKIGPKKIIGKMKLGDAIHAVEADYQGTIFYVGSESSYFFIGTAEEFDRDITKIGAEYKKQFRGTNKRTSRELKDILHNLSTYSGDEFSEEVYNRQEDLIRSIAKTSKYHDAYHNWVDIEKRTVKQCYVRDALGEFNEGGLVMIVPGYEDGKWAFYHEYQTKKIQTGHNTVYIPPKEDEE